MAIAPNEAPTATIAARDRGHVAEQCPVGAFAVPYAWSTILNDTPQRSSNRTNRPTERTMQQTVAPPLAHHRRRAAPRARAGRHLARPSWPAAPASPSRRSPSSRRAPATPASRRSGRSASRSACRSAGWSSRRRRSVRVIRAGEGPRLPLRAGGLHRHPAGRRLAPHARRDIYVIELEPGASAARRRAHPGQRRARGGGRRPGAHRPGRRAGRARRRATTSRSPATCRTVYEALEPGTWAVLVMEHR